MSLADNWSFVRANYSIILLRQESLMPGVLNSWIIENCFDPERVKHESYVRACVCMRVGTGDSRKRGMHEN